MLGCYDIVLLTNTKEVVYSMVTILISSILIIKVTTFYKVSK